MYELEGSLDDLDIDIEDDFSFVMSGAPSKMTTLRKIAKLRGFKKINGKDICPDCFKTRT
jgi:hypothetical protein